MKTLGYMEYGMILLYTNILFINIIYYWNKNSNSELFLVIVYLAPLGLNNTFYLNVNMGQINVDSWG